MTAAREDRTAEGRPAGSQASRLTALGGASMGASDAERPVRACYLGELVCERARGRPGGGVRHAVGPTGRASRAGAPAGRDRHRRPCPGHPGQTPGSDRHLGGRAGGHHRRSVRRCRVCRQRKGRSIFRYGPAHRARDAVLSGRAFILGRSPGPAGERRTGSTGCRSSCSPTGRTTWWPRATRP